MIEKSHICAICDLEINNQEKFEVGVARGTTERFHNCNYRLWRCPNCETIQSEDQVDYADLYNGYPLNDRRMDFVAFLTNAKVVWRLWKAGFRRHHSLLDFGCGNGAFVQTAKKLGYAQVRGFDPYVSAYADEPTGKKFDWVVMNDVIEHTEKVREVLKNAGEFVKDGGYLYVGTPDVAEVEMNKLERHAMKLHQPFHRVILSREMLKRLGKVGGFQPTKEWNRSYIDTLVPFVNYRFIEEVWRSVGNVMDRALDPAVGRKVLTSPRLLFFGFFGYFFASVQDRAVLFRKIAEAK